MSDEPVPTERLTAVSEKLLRETERLRRDVQQLINRMKPLDDLLPDVLPETLPTGRRAAKTFAEVFTVLQAARQNVSGLEYPLNAIRSMLDTVANDVTSREELKGYIIEPPRRGRGR